VSDLQFHVLGPLLVTAGDEPVRLGRGRLRTLLAILLLHPNEPVSVNHITERLWGDAPPVSPRSAIQTCVVRLRQALGGGELIETAVEGYLIRLSAGQLDLTTFDGLTRAAEAATAAGDLAGAHALLADAVRLWRGPALADIRSDLLHGRDLPLLAERRRRAEEAWAETGLRLGRHAEVVPRLRDLVSSHPLHERFWAQLMTALYRSGRPAEALDAYQAVRRRLVEELGVDPGTELRRLHQAVLTGDPGLTAPARPARPARAPAQTPAPAGDQIPEPAEAAEAVVPRQLPPAVRGFTGRDTDLARLDALLGGPGSGEQADAVPIAVVAGTAGVGKSALAAQWARRVADRFPDGQLWVNLRGYDPDQPMTPRQALTVFLRALGVPGSQIPVELDAQTGLYRSLLAGRRLLVVLDNANSPDQVRPLLPGAPGCLVLVTSRDDLPGLVARDGATRVRLGRLSETDAVALLRRLLGPAAEPGAAAELTELAQLCARLPLALRIAAERISSSSRPVGEAVAELAAEPRLDALAAGDDPHTAARAVLSWSYQALPPAAASLFRRFGLVPGADWDAPAAAALAGRPLPDVRRLLATLASTHLVEEHRGRYQMHDLLRAYAAEHVHAEDTEPDRAAATTRLLDHYLSTAATAMDVAFPHEKARRPDVPRSGRPVPALTDPPRAMAWLDAERSNLVAAALHAADHGWPGHTARIAATVYRYLLIGAHHADALTLHQRALAETTRGQDRAGQGTALNNLGNVCWQLGQYDRAFGYYQRALALRRSTGDRAGEAAVLNNLGVICMMRGSYDEAFVHYGAALAIHHETANLAAIATTLGNLGRVHVRLGRQQEALDHQQRALAVYQEIGDRAGEANSLSSLGTIYLRWERYAQALDHYQRALAMHREAGDRPGQTDALSCLGTVQLRCGRPDQAFPLYRQALGLAREIGHSDLELTVLNALGEASQAAGRPADALGQHRAALGLARTAGDRYEQARAFDGLGQAQDDLGDHQSARRHWQRALELYTALGVPEAARVRSRLDSAVAGCSRRTGAGQPSSSSR
jgi:DNA-binding SARP family transcriptional activator/tetratricopeptide (TPR) repeat protein